MSDINKVSWSNYYKYTFNFNDPEATTSDKVAKAAAIPISIIGGAAAYVVLAAGLLPSALFGCSNCDNPSLENIPDSSSANNVRDDGGDIYRSNDSGIW
ncbi:MAG: hypothetical protein ABIH50_07060 [bacterium]